MSSALCACRDLAWAARVRPRRPEAAGVHVWVRGERCVELEAHNMRGMDYNEKIVALRSFRFRCTSLERRRYELRPT